MSYDVDSRIVEMRFDNKQFEADASQTMKTLDKLNESLQFEGASKGFDEMEKASKKINFETLAKSVDSIADKFTLLGTIQRKVFDDIANRIVGLEHKFEALIKSMSIDQIMTGWDKYAEKTASVQTIMAATSNEIEDTGERMKYVNQQLKILNWFTDETSHKYLDMVNNIGKFTANQVPLEQAVTAMQGIAIWASKSGANATEASRAMYNLSQALSSGSLKLMDWKSIELANMATAEFKQTAIQTAEEMGTLTKVADGLWQTVDGTEVSVKKFRDTLSSGWINSKVLLGTLSKYGDFSVMLREAVEATGMSTYEMLHTIDDYRAGMLDLDNLAEELEMNSEDLDAIIGTLASDSMQFGKEAFQAAQETKTFAEAIDYVKEAVSTGWMNTFEIIFGDYANAKKLWSELSEWLYGVFVEAGDARNEMLQLWDAIGGRDQLIQGFKNIAAAIESVIIPIKQAWRDLFPEMTADKLYYITMLFRRLTEAMIRGETAGNGIYRVFKVLFAPIKALASVAKTAGLIIVWLASKFADFVEKILEFIGSGDSMLDIIGKMSEESSFLSTIFTILGVAINIVLTPLKLFGALLERVLEGFKQTYGVEKTAELFTMLGNSIKNSLISALAAVVTGLQTCFGFMEKHLPTAEQMSKVITFIGNAFKFVGGVISGAFSACIAFFSGANKATEELAEGTEKLTKTTTSFKDLWKERMGPLGDQLKSIFSTVFSEENHQRIKTLTTDIWNFFASLSTGQTVALILISMVVLFMNQLRLLAKAATSFIKSFSGIGDMFLAIKGYFKALTQAVKYSALLQIGAGFVLIASAMWILSKIDSDQIGVVTGAIIGIAAAISALLFALSSFQSVTKSALAVGAALAALGIGLLGVTGAIKTLSTIDFSNNGTGVGGLLAAIGSVFILLGALYLLAKSPMIKVAAFQILAFGLSINQMAKAFSSMATSIAELKQAGIMGDELKTAIHGIAGSIIAFAAAMRIAAGVNFNSGVGVIATAIGFLLFLQTIKKIVQYGIEIGKWLSTFNNNVEQNMHILDGIADAFLLIGGTMALVIWGMKKISKDMLIASGGVLLAVLAIKMAVSAMKSLGTEGVNMTGIENFALGLIGVTAAFWAVSRVLAHMETDYNAWKTIITIAAVCLSVGASLRLLSNMSLGEVITSLIALGGGLIAIGLSLRIASNEFAASSKAILSMAAVIVALVGALVVLSVFDYETELSGPLTALCLGMISAGAALRVAGGIAQGIDWKAILAMTAAIAVICGTLIALVAMKANLLEVAGAAIGLGAAITAVGFAAKLAGQSNWTTFAPLLAAAGTVVAVGYAFSLIAQSTGIMTWNQIITSLAGLGSAIVLAGLAVKLASASGFASGLGTAMAMAGTALAIVAVGAALAQIAALPTDSIYAAMIALDGSIAILAGVVAALGALGVPAAIGTGVILGIAVALNKGADAFVKFAQNVGAFASGIEALGQAIQTIGAIEKTTVTAAISNIVDFGKAVIKTIGEITPSMVATMEESGQYVAIGFQNGVLRQTPSVKVAAVTLWNSFFSQFNKSAAIASPSRAMYQDGVYTIQGFVNGAYENRKWMKEVADGVWEEYENEFDAAAGIHGNVCEASIQDGLLVTRSAAYAIVDSADLVGNAATAVGERLSGVDQLNAFAQSGISDASAYLGGAKDQLLSGFDAIIQEIKDRYNFDLFGGGGITSWLDEAPKFLNEHDEQEYRELKTSGASKEEIEKALGYDPRNSTSRMMAQMQREMDDAVGKYGEGADAADMFGDAAGAAGGSAAKGAAEVTESLEDLLDVTQWASEAVIYFKSQYDAQAKTLLDISPWEKAIGATEDLVFEYAKLGGAMDAELAGVENFADMNSEQAKKVKETWTSAFDSIRGSLSQGFGSAFTTPTFAQGTAQLDQIWRADDMIGNLQGQINQATYFKNTLTKLYQEGLDEALIQELMSGGPENLAQIVSYDQLTAAEIQEVNNMYRQLNDTMDNLTIDVILAQAEAWSGGVGTISNTIYSTISSQDYSDIQNEVSKQTAGLLEKVLDADTNWEEFQGTRLGELLNEGIASGIEDMKDVAISAVEQLGRELVDAMQQSIEQEAAIRQQAVQTWNDAVISSGGAIMSDAEFDWVMQAKTLSQAMDYFSGGSNYDPSKIPEFEKYGDITSVRHAANAFLNSSNDIDLSNIQRSDLVNQLSEGIVRSTASKISEDMISSSASSIKGSSAPISHTVNQYFTSTNDGFTDAYVGEKSAVAVFYS